MWNINIIKYFRVKYVDTYKNKDHFAILFSQNELMNIESQIWRGEKNMLYTHFGFKFGFGLWSRNSSSDASQRVDIISNYTLKKKIKKKNQ